MAMRLSNVSHHFARVTQRRADKITAGLAVLSLATAGSVIGGHIIHMARRRMHRPDSHETFLEATSHATQDSVTVAVEGLREAPHHERVLFNLLSSFIATIGFVRLSTWGIRGGWWPVGNTSVGGHHIHHFVPGIMLAFAAGTASLVTDNEKIESRLAIPFGAGMGLTFDEAALLLDFEDVYWSQEGLLSVQVSLGVSALLGATLLGLRMLDRGERRAEQLELIPQA
jgi:hypothetical protein